MALARVVSFDGVNADRMAEMQREMESGDRPDDVPAKEIIVLHDAEADQALVILFFDSEDDYRRGDEALNAMPAGDTPGRRSSVAKYDVATRMTARTCTNSGRLPDGAVVLSSRAYDKRARATSPTASRAS